LSEPQRAVLDTDVIFSRVLYELFGRLALQQRLLTLVWSDELLAEAERVLAARKPLPAAVAAQWVGYLREVFPQETRWPRDAGSQHRSRIADQRP